MCSVVLGSSRLNVSDGLRPTAPVRESEHHWPRYQATGPPEPTDMHKWGTERTMQYVMLEELRIVMVQPMVVISGMAGVDFADHFLPELRCSEHTKRNRLRYKKSLLPV